MKTQRKYTVLIITVMIALIAAFTNPGLEKHKDAIKAKFNTYLQNSMMKNMSETDNKWEQTGNALGMMLGSALVDGMIDNMVSTDNYILFSITKVSWQGETKVIGFGAFGNVYISSELDQKLDEGLLDENNQ